MTSLEKYDRYEIFKKKNLLFVKMNMKILIPL